MQIIADIREDVRIARGRISEIVRKLEESGLRYTVDDIVKEFKRCMRVHTLFNFMNGVIAELSRNGKTRTSEAYRSALNSFSNFRQGRDVMLEAITSELLQNYESWQHNRGVSPNTISFYARILRAVYNRAIEKGLISDLSPFRHIYTGVEKTVKRALPLSVISKLKRLDLSNRPSLDYARDMFLFSFYLRGMSFVDMSFLRKSDLHNGMIVYRRRKTGQRLSIRWLTDMQKILDKYPVNQTGYLLPIIRMPVHDERRRYRNVASTINRSLKKLGAMIGVSIPLTLYCARHSWATAARSKGVPISVISEGMGHDSETTTLIYLASIDTNAVDRANARIICSL